jgi:hypothetical protein
MASVLPNMSANYRVRLPLNNHWYELARGTLSGKGNPLRTGRGIRHGRGDQNLVLGPRTPMAGIGSASRNVGSRAPGMLNRSSREFVIGFGARLKTTLRLALR